MLTDRQKPRDLAAELRPVGNRVPPHDLDAEAAVLSASLLSSEAFDRVQEILSPEHFYADANRRIFEAVLDLQSSGKPVDLVSVAGWLRDRERLAQVGGTPYLAQLADATPAVAHVEHHAQVIRQKWRVRQLIATCQRYAAEGYTDYGDVQSFIDQAEQAVFDIARIPEGTTVVSVKDAIHGAFQMLAEAARRGGGITGTPTGFTQLDRKMAGLHAGDLYIVAGRPGMGKTALVLNMAVNVALPRRRAVQDAADPYAEGDIEESGDGVAFFSLEMPREQLASRLLAVEARVDVSRIRSGEMRREDWNKLTDAAARLGRLPLWLDDTPALTLLDLRAKIRRLQADLRRGDAPGGARKLGLVCVDYLQLMQGRRDAHSREQEISELSRGLKQLAKEMQVPVLALSQLNRSVETRAGKDKRPQLSDLRECVTGDTLVSLADGSRRPIRELVGSAPGVVALSPEDRVVTAQAECVWEVGERDVFALRLASGRELCATLDHRVYTGRGWRRLHQIAPGDRVALARRLPEPEGAEKWTEERVALLGHLIGDGSYLVHQPLRYTTASEEYAAIVQRAAEREFGSRVVRYPGRGRWFQLVISGNGDRWHPRGLGAWLKELGVFGQRSHEKRIPEAAFRLDDAQIALLLRHLWATDGTVHARRKGRGSSALVFSTASRGLALDVAALLLRIGVVARIRTVHQKRGRPMYTAAISGAEQQLRFVEMVGAVGYRCEQAEQLVGALTGTDSNPNVDTLPIEVFERVRHVMRQRGISQRRMAALRGTSYGGTSHFRFAPSREERSDASEARRGAGGTEAPTGKVLGEYATLLDDAELLNAAESDLFWDRVMAIEPAGRQRVYDLTVPGAESWLADGIVSHNSGAIEQDADAIVFIYRDDYYSRESPEPGVAELIVAKQRNGPTCTVKVKFTAEYTRFDNLASEEYEFDEADEFDAGAA